MYTFNTSIYLVQMKNKIKSEKVLWVAITWEVRKHKNNTIFRQDKVNVEKIFNMTQFNV